VHDTDKDGWPYSKIEHWPPMTYRERVMPTASALSAFMAFLKTEPSREHVRELQPWIPFCEGKCAFCYFPVECKKQSTKPYLAALKKALAFYAENKYVKSSLFNELYVGGGSPSVLPNQQIIDLLQYCRSAFNFSRDYPTKFTACTTNLSEDKIRMLSANRVQQLDIGIQTFNDSLRKMLQVRDNSTKAKLKLRTAKKHDLRVSIDLLYNLPGQTVKQWKEDVKQALELEVESVDCYPLDLYPETPLAKKIAAGELPPIGNLKTELQMYLEAYRMFKENGYAPTCHNRFSRLKEDFNKPSSEIVGTGAGFFMGHIGSFLYSDIENAQEYIEAVKKGVVPIAKLAKLSAEEEKRKAMMLIYVRVPVDRDEFKSQFGMFPEKAFPEQLAKLQRKGLIEVRDNKIRLAEKGDPWRFNIAWEFFKNNGP
jgi:coproporphyrinogen III oxidase-like Fe-S oxidoreductase